MAKKKSNKRKSMGAGTRSAAQAAKTGIVYLNVPKGIKLFKEEANKRYNLDIVPSYVKNPKNHPDAQYIDDIWWRRPFLIHKNIGPDKKDIICPRSIGKKCRICEDRKKLYEDPNGDEDIAKLLKAKDRVLYYVVPKKSKDYSEEPHLWEISYHNFGKCLDKELEYEEDCAGFADLDGGHTLKARFDEVKIGKFPFPQCDRIDFKPRDGYDEDILEDLPDLETCLVVLTDKEIAKIYGGIDDVSGYDDDKGTDKGDKDEEEEPEEDEEEEIDEEEDEEVELSDMSKKELLEYADNEDIELTKKERKLPKKKLLETIEGHLEETENEEEEEPEEDIDIDDVEDGDLLEFAEEKDIELTKKEKKLKGKKLRKLIEKALEEEEEEDEEEDEEEPVKKGKGKSKDKSKSKNKCPHKHKFGDDNGEYDECTDCDVYDDCLDALE